MSKVHHMRYTFDMTIADKIYKEVDDFGLITSAEARKFGVTNAELVQQAHRGKLVHVARGVYRMPIWPFQEAAPYAIAVKAVGEGARLYGESVIALLGLAPTNPSRMWVAAPGRVRRNIGEGVNVVRCDANDPVTYFEGIPCQILINAITDAARTMGTMRAIEAAHEAEKQGYLTYVEASAIERELGDDKEA